ncbi:type II toxin-antitoxin system VapC family toxin [soil metagenome]
MRLLLDTNILIRMLEEPHLLKARVRDLLDDLDNALVVTTVSLVEIAIKVGTGKLVMPDNLISRLESLECELLPVHARHAMRMARLPVVHKDPFDRLIVAQAMADDLMLVTTDSQLADYGVAMIQA